MRVALELVLAGDERDLERLLADEDVGGDVDAAGAGEGGSCARLDWSSTTSV